MRVAERAGAAGFTLIEVLVALAVVGMAMAAMAGVFSNGLLGHETAAGAEEALAVAEERLALAAAGPAFAPGIAKGTFADRFAWQTTVAPYAEDGDAGKFAAAKDALRLYRIAVSVAWRDGRRGRQLSLSTLRLGTAATP
jgi:general secretion pathway protein I